jgi:predicted alpha-1,2-mannosidase
MSIAVVAQTKAQTDLASQVDPLIGTKTNQFKDNGNTTPGATRPFGMLYWSPDPANGDFYRYETPVTRGFGLTHISGPGCGTLGDAPMMVVKGKLTQLPYVRSAPIQAAFRHEDETAEPGYYAVKLDSGIRVQLAAGERSGLAEIDFPDDGDVHTLFVDLSRNLTRVNDASLSIANGKMTGSVTSAGFCGLEDTHKMYFAYQLEGTPQEQGTFSEAGFAGPGSVSGARTGGYAVFPAGTRKIHVKVGISFVSVANAEANAAKEIPSWDLDALRHEARAAWNEKLGHIEVRGGSAESRGVFYSALYHALLHPSIFSDVNGDYIGFDEKIHHVAQGHLQFANYSGWDIYRCQVQLIAMLFPKQASDIAQSLVNDAEQGGGLPIWPVANDESSVMVGDPSDPILASIYAFGARDFDAKKALELMVRGADDPEAHVRLYPERPHLKELLTKGYIAEGEDSQGSASVSLEDETADFSVSQMAAALGDQATADRMLHRSANWRKLFDPDTRYIRPRMADGSFMQKFTTSTPDGFVEGNTAQYTWMVPFDLKSVVDAMGGPEVAKTRLDSYFSQYGAWNGGPYFYISNEPSFGDPWIYNWTGHPWRTQEVVHKTIGDLFTATPDGLPGNDDLGATSAWVVFALLGVYPEIPGVGGVTLNSPSFEEATLKLGDKSFEIQAPGAPANLYVSSVSLDGKAVHNWWIGWDEMARSSRLEFKLADKPNKDVGELPPSFPAQMTAGTAVQKGPDAYLQPLVTDGTLAGAVTLISDKDNNVYVKAVGYRDLASKAPMASNDLFWIASTSKPMTVTAFMMLVDEGKINVNDPVEKYLPEFKGQLVKTKANDAAGSAPVPANHPILVREILSHTSGLPFKSAAQPGALDTLPLKQAVKSFAAEPLNFQPGTEYAYSNEGINTAARIIEVVSGMPYERFMQERLFTPLGMNDTTFWPNAEQIKRLAKTYKFDPQSKELKELQINQLTYPLDDRTHRYPMPAGGIFSTAEDVAKFCRMILNGGAIDGKRYISAQALHVMTSEQNSGFGGSSYGFGWGVSKTGFGHGGAFRNAMEIDTAKGRILIFMVQQDGPWGTSAGDAIVPTLEKMADEIVAGGVAAPTEAQSSR